MKAVRHIERGRLAIQAELDACKTQQARNQLGQFATPTALAADILDHARMLLPKDARLRFLDPAIGTGSFYSALLGKFAPEQIAHAEGIEIDPHYADAARAIWSKHPLKLRLADFTATPAPDENARFNLLICNPPYVRHHHIGAKEKARLQTATAQACGVPIGGLSGLYCYFLALAHQWLADDGIAGWLIPSEFMDVNYGEAVKRYLLTQVELIRIHRFNPSDVQFGDALVSSAVVWFRKRRPRAGHQVEFSYGGTHASPALSRLIPHSALQSSAKWTQLVENGVKADVEGARLSDYFQIKRGLATGDNRFFMLSKADIESRDLPFEFFKPILPGPRYLQGDIVEAGRDGVPLLDRQLFLLDCRLPEKDIQARYPSLWAYLQTGKPAVSDTYLCQHRKPWYAQENRPPTPFLCTYMGRTAKSGVKPFRFILNKSQATAANVYLLLYPRPVLADAVARDAGLAERIWKFLCSIPAQSLVGEGRVYGGGLYKMEPKELANVAADEIAALIGHIYRPPQRQDDLFREKVA